MFHLFGMIFPSQYKISSDTLRTATLNLSVWHHDSFGRNSFLGEADVDLREWNFIDSQMKDYLLRPRVNRRRYNETQTRASVTHLESRNAWSYNHSSYLLFVTCTGCQPPQNN